MKCDRRDGFDECRGADDGHGLPPPSQDPQVQVESGAGDEEGDGEAGGEVTLATSHVLI